MTQKLIIEIPDDTNIVLAIDLMRDLEIFCAQNVGMKYYWEKSK
jgi:hypothetical protein